MSSYTVQPGIRYRALATGVPFFISTGRIQHGVETQGFTGVTVVKGDEGTVVEATWPGSAPPTSLDVPSAVQKIEIVGVPPAPGTAPPGVTAYATPVNALPTWYSPPAASSNWALWSAAGLAAVGAAWWFAHRMPHTAHR